MDTEKILLISLVISVFGTLLTGYPAALSLAGTSIIHAAIGAWLGVFDFSLLSAIPMRLFGIFNNESLLSLSLFIYMGVIFSSTGVANDLLKALLYFTQKRQQFPIAVVFVGTVMAATTGIVSATVISLGTIALPLLLENKYSEKLSCGLICAVGTLGQIIPPSIILILLADTVSNAYFSAQVSLGNYTPEAVTANSLFLGAIVPGLTLAACFTIYFLIKSKNRTPVALSNLEKPTIFSIVGPGFLVLSVLGSILTGLATPSEASAVGVVGSLGLGYLRNKNLNQLYAMNFKAFRLVSITFLLVVAASVFSLVFHGFGGERIVVQWADGQNNTSLILILSMILIFFLGFMLETYEIILVIVPILGPVLFRMGVDPIWFSILFAINLQTAYLTPPIGLSLFFFRTIAPKSISTQTIYKGAVPYIAIQVLVFILVYQFPQIATWLPSNFSK